MEDHEQIMGKRREYYHGAHGFSAGGDGLGQAHYHYNAEPHGKKRAVAHKQGARAKTFYPVVSRGEVSMQETRGFLEKVYRGSLGMMVNAMVEDQALSKEEIQELYTILEKAKVKGMED